MKNTLIQQLPSISNERLEELIRKIKPVVKLSKTHKSGINGFEYDETGKLYFIQDVDPRHTSFATYPKPTKMAIGINPEPYLVIITNHAIDSIVFFTPTVAEVLAQIPPSELERCVAFETKYRGVSDDSLYHTGYTKLYEKKK
jgi:hypothetical protein